MAAFRRAATRASVLPRSRRRRSSPTHCQGWRRRCTSGLTNYGREILSGNSSATIQPGIYKQITVSGYAELTLSSGIYIIEGGGFSVSGNASVSGSGVTIFNAGSQYPIAGGTYGNITLSGNGSYNLSPPTSGTYTGIVIFQPKDNTNALSFSGNASGMTGAIYAPAARLNESGNGQLNAAIVVDTLTFSGNGIDDTWTLVRAPRRGRLDRDHAKPRHRQPPATASSSSPCLMALDLTLADASTTTVDTASEVTPIAAGGQVAQSTGNGCTLNVVTTAKPTTVDPAAMDALLLEGLSLRSRRIADRPGQPMKWLI